MQNIPKELWMMVPIEERIVLVNDFKLTKTGYTEVHDNVVISDGYSTEDLRVLTAERLADYVGSEPTESMLRLWELTVAKARSIVNPPMGTISDGVVVDDGGDITVADVTSGAIIEEVNEPAHASAKKAKK